MPAPYRKLTVAIALCGIFTLGIWPAFHSPAIPMDEGMVLVYPEMILKGQLPYRDFESITGPGNSMILAGAYAGFGPNLFVERAVGLAYRIFIVLAIFGIAQRWGNGRCHVELALFCRRPPRRRCPLRAPRFWTSIAGADWVILNRRWDFLNELNRSTAFGSDEPNQIVRENFELWWQGGAYLLFRNKRISNAIVPPPP